MYSIPHQSVGSDIAWAFVNYHSLIPFIIRYQALCPCRVRVQKDQSGWQFPGAEPSTSMSPSHRPKHALIICQEGGDVGGAGRRSCVSTQRVEWGQPICTTGGSSEPRLARVPCEVVRNSASLAAREVPSNFHQARDVLAARPRAIHWEYELNSTSLAGMSWRFSKPGGRCRACSRAPSRGSRTTFGRPRRSADCTW